MFMTDCFGHTRLRQRWAPVVSIENGGVKVAGMYIWMGQDFCACFWLASFCQMMCWDCGLHEDKFFLWVC